MLECRGLAFVPRLSTIRVLIPHLAIHIAIIRPAGPAPTIRRSTLSGAGAPSTVPLTAMLVKTNAVGGLRVGCCVQSWNREGEIPFDIREKT